MVTKLKDFPKIFFPLKKTEQSALSIFEEGVVPFSIKRVFTIKTQDHCKRGFHAHKECAQLLVCLTGRCTVICDDGESRQSIVLDTPKEGLLIPPSIWAEQDYEPNTILMVLTDHLYDESDYIRDYNEFLQYRRTLK
ncbi:MAG: sugar 3,4-ketoisomerase [Alphaproteobacteria bacterium]